jgi:hypothetical protein
MLLPGALASCFDGVRNGGEAGVDCGGSCSAECSVGAPNGGSRGGSKWKWPLLVGLLAAAAVVVCIVVAAVMRRRRRHARDRVSSANAFIRIPPERFLHQRTILSE